MITLSDLSAHFDLPTNRLYAAKDRLAHEGRPITDLVSGNLNDQGIVFPPAILGRALAAARKKCRTYRPDPLGQREAREALSRWYAAQGLAVPSAQILLTPGTSVSYWYAFKTLANPGDEILTPAPCYPLFDSIAALCGVNLVPYRLAESAGWRIDIPHLTAAVTPRAKAIILVSPHNPTGAVATAEEVRMAAEIAARKNLTIISDEVFSPFLYGPQTLHRPARTEAPLVITLNGFSKMLALPGLKLGWMAVTGHPPMVQRAIKTLEMVSDTFLPVNEAAQSMVPPLIDQSSSFLNLFRAQILKRMDLVQNLLKDSPLISWVKPEGGFFITLRLPNGHGEEETAMRLLTRHQVLVHPGYFYDMEGRHLVMSFVSRPPVLRRAIRAISRVVGTSSCGPEEKRPCAL